ncbi:TlpA disulfide reductase family protein [Pontibacillus sp. HMF3514]|uniref:TlpA disulfide reductase family protein n=1 Tax=Pontibacillus sp. HMF3514 TaxID=2692425 RepID=UPI00132045E9|nr:TlpA disulfide reductase family protein [Pontibacillus sp. HMF3514]QHE53441.1 redoxin domain-containing protein [Pontibacillus sp. HMF3514]
MKAPLFELQTIDGETYQLEQDLGKVVMLTFWASWCPDCGRDLPKKEQFYQSVPKDQVKMLTINVVGRERNVQEGLNYAEKFLTQPTLLDDGRKTYDQYECEGVPTTIIIDQNGEIAHHFGDKAVMMDIIKAVGEII